ncbi:hypothetical protein F4778DRAFT_777139 [Xylariomycetidae sp. FL2044]|nr:hypothetical protein F4778DRAFT_777139 [Xylariomycetidae sp. FL2044]
MALSQPIVRLLVIAQGLSTEVYRTMIEKYAYLPRVDRRRPKQEPRDPKTHEAPFSREPHDVELLKGDRQDPADDSWEYWAAATRSSGFTSGNYDQEELEHCQVRFRTGLNGCQIGTEANQKTASPLEDVCIIHGNRATKGRETPSENCIADTPYSSTLTAVFEKP